MVEYLKPLLDDDYFTIQPGLLPGRSRFSGADLGPGIIYYPSDLNLDFHLAGSAASVPVRQPLPAGLSALWNAGSETEIFNHEAEPSEFVRVALKPPASLMAEIPEQFIGPAYASLLQADWDQPFKESVRNDLDIIGAIVDPLLHRRYVPPLQFEHAIAAKEDLDLKLMWCAGEYRRLNVFKPGNLGTMLAVAATTGTTGVTVNTVDMAQNPVHGCVVWYVAYISRNNNTLYNSFGRLSTPTSGTLAIGIYEMWAEKGGTTGAKRKVGISSTSNTVDIIAP